MANYVVGDIQGCYDPLRRLLDKVEYCPDKDKLWAVGDLIGRGPNSSETLSFLHSLDDSFETVLGNHDLHFLSISQNIKSNSPSNKYEALLKHPQLDTYVQWLRHKPLALKLNDNYLITHAGLFPGWSFEQALHHSREIEVILQNSQWKDLLRDMYGSDPALWSEDYMGTQRHNFIINAFTRMRFIDQQQQLEFSEKDYKLGINKGLVPWFNLENALIPGQHVLFGHWASLLGETNSTLFIGLDTGCLWGRKLTLIKLENHQRYAVSHT